MFSSPRPIACGLFVAVIALLSGAASAQSADYPGIGRAATAQELKAWDIDVRPDFKGLPKGSGSVAAGMDVWESKCASCHGIFGESNQTFTPLVGGSTDADIKSGRVARLLDPAYPARTTLMKVATVSTLFDYIRRAMPWNAPKSLAADEVYAVTAFLLNLGGVVADDFTLSDANIAEVQQRLPNRNGMSTDHGLWPGKGMGNGGKPDVQATACMKNCTGAPTLRSFLPDFARSAHGNLAEQNRLVGAQHGADTSQPPGASPLAAATAALATASAVPPAIELVNQNGCTTCHGVDARIVGPAFADIAQKYAERGDRSTYLAGKIVEGGSGVWGEVPMPAQTLSADDAKAIADWIADGAPKSR